MSAPLRLHYDLHNAGWATVTVECGDEKVEMTASYLHDSLRDLAAGARVLVRKGTEAAVVFMDEPGEHQMVVRRISDKEVDLEIWWYDDWRSWNIVNGPAKSRLFGKTSASHIRE